MEVFAAVFALGRVPRQEGFYIVLLGGTIILFLVGTVLDKKGDKNFT